ncbi:MAG: hypothetical protein C3F19_09455 [Rhodocyclales bacterium]|nr:MAG: hypothetical protein C3F19_09455 [Rhodocyclales bacterium]
MAAVKRGQERRWQTAIHEAGHALARVRFNLYIGNTTIVQDGNILGASSGEESWGTRKCGEIEVLVFCAGYAAVVASGIATTKAIEGCWQDFDEAVRIIEYWGLDPLAAWQQRAVKMMQQPENIRAVELIASKLTEHQMIGPDYLACLVALSDGEVSEKDFSEYLARAKSEYGREPHLI